MSGVESRKRICLIYTGGTIGMVRELHGSEWVLTPPPDDQDDKQFLRLLNAEKDIHEIAEIDFFRLMNEDSTNLVPLDWATMANAVYEKLDHYDGFVIAHGTDTMHFSASALAFAFGRNLRKPIVFTGAQTAPDIPYGDAKVNLLRAVKVACEDLAEVVIAFGDFVFRGCRAQKKDEKRFDAFESPAQYPLGYITEEIVLSGFARRPKDVKQDSKLKFRPLFAEGIVQFSLIPGLEPELLYGALENPRCKGIVLQSFGAGNVPNKPPYSFEGFIKTAVERGIPVVIASQFPANSTLASIYKPGKAAVAAGAIPTGNMTNAAATVKFRWVLKRINDELGELPAAVKLKRINKMMNANFVDEITVAKSDLADLDDDIA